MVCPTGSLIHSRKHRLPDVDNMASRWLFLSGEHGGGKSEVIVHAAAEAATAGYHVLILCPTGSLVHSCKDRLPDVDNIVVQTLNHLSRSG